MFTLFSRFFLTIADIFIESYRMRARLEKQYPYLPRE